MRAHALPSFLFTNNTNSKRRNLGYPVHDAGSAPLPPVWQGKQLGEVTVHVKHAARDLVDALGQELGLRVSLFPEQVQGHRQLGKVSVHRRILGLGERLLHARARALGAIAAESRFELDENELMRAPRAHYVGRRADAALAVDHDALRPDGHQIVIVERVET